MNRTLVGNYPAGFLETSPVFSGSSTGFFAFYNEDCFMTMQQSGTMYCMHTLGLNSRLTAKYADEINILEQFNLPKDLYFLPIHYGDLHYMSGREGNLIFLFFSKLHLGVLSASYI